MVLDESVQRRSEGRFIDALRSSADQLFEINPTRVLVADLVIEHPALEWSEGERR